MQSCRYKWRPTSLIIERDNMIQLTNKHSVPIVATLLFALSFGTTMNAYAQGGFWDLFTDKKNAVLQEEAWPVCSTKGNTTGIPCSDSGPGGNAGEGRGGGPGF